MSLSPRDPLTDDPKAVVADIRVSDGHGRHGHSCRRCQRVGHGRDVEGSPALPRARCEGKILGGRLRSLRRSMRPWELLRGRPVARRRDGSANCGLLNLGHRAVRIVAHSRRHKRADEVPDCIARSCPRRRPGWDGDVRVHTTARRLQQDSSTPQVLHARVTAGWFGVIQHD